MKGNIDMFKNWTVMEKENGERGYFYGGLDDFEEEDLEGYIKQVAEEDLNCEDLAELFGNELEDKNYHKITNLGWQILSSLNTNTNLSEKEKADILRSFISDFMTHHNMIRKSN